MRKFIVFSGLFPLLLILSSAASAHFFVSISGMAARQSNQGTTFTVRNFQNGALFIPDGVPIDIETRYRLSLGGVIGYVFDTGLDLKLSVLVNNHSDKRTVSSPNAAEGNVSTIIGSDGLPGQVPFFFTATLTPPLLGGGTASLIVNSVFSHKTVLTNLELGHWYHVGHDFWFHPSIGLNVSYLEGVQKTHYGLMVLPFPLGFSAISSTATVSSNHSSDVIESFKTTAVGPFIGLDLSYDILRPLSLWLDGKVGTLLGGPDTSFYANTPIISISESQQEGKTRYRQKGDTAIIDYLDMQAGLNYHFYLFRRNKGEIKAGYRIVKYSDINGSYNLPRFLVRFFEHSGFYGPFLNMTVYL